MTPNLPSLILGVSWAETALGLIFLALRAITNWKLVKGFRWDFAFASFTVALGTVGQVFLQLSVNHGMGQHMESLSESNRVAALKWSWVFQLLLIATSCFGKIAIVTFLIQIRGLHEKRPWFLGILGGLILVFNAVVFGTILAQCDPVPKLWDDSLPGSCDPGRKRNQNYSFFQASFNTFSDAALATYPIHLFWKLQMKRRIKIALCFLMGMGWFAAGCSGVKTYELQALTKTDDITYAQPPLLIWAATEGWVVVLVGCIPPVRPLMEQILRKLNLTSQKSTSRTARYNGGGSSNRAMGRSLAYANVSSHTQSACRPANGKEPPSEDASWVELTKAERGLGGRKEVEPNLGDVVVTTEIDMVYDDMHKRESRSTSRRNKAALF